jgi:urea transport system permease protein
VNFRKKQLGGATFALRAMERPRRYSSAKAKRRWEDGLLNFASRKRIPLPEGGLLTNLCRLLNNPGWLLAVAFSLAASSVALALTPEQIKPLAEDDFDAKAQALDQIVAAGDDASKRILEALRDERLYANKAGQLLIQDGESYHDALTNSLVESKADDLQSIDFNNVLREKVAMGLAGLQLTSPDRAIRAQAVQALLGRGDSALRPVIEKARSSETDPGLRAQLDQLWASTALRDPDPQRRKEAIAVIEQRHDPQLRLVLAPLLAKQSDGTFVETDPTVRKQVEQALASLEREEAEIQFVGTLFAGISLGSILLLAALGLAITYGLIGVINMAHGEFLMIGAYATYCVQNLFVTYWPGAFDWYLLAAVPTSFLAAAVVGLVLERSVIRLLYGRPLETLLATFGISLILIEAVRTKFGAQNVQVANPRWMSGGITVLPELILPFNRIVIIGFALVVVLITWYVIQRTRLGLYIRAVTQNRQMAACVGIRTWQVDCYAFAFGAGIAGLGGCALSQIGNVGPDLGQSYIIDSFMAVVLGGVGQLIGTIVGALGLGVLSKLIEPFWGAVLAKIAILILVVLFIQKRPQGLFALKGRSAEV